MKDFHFCKHFKIISIALVVALVLQVVPLGAFAADTQVNNYISTSQNLETERIAEVLYEDESRREETVKHFRMDDGTYSAVEYSVPVHYVDSKGKLKDIDNSLEPITLDDGTSAYINKDNTFSVTLPDDLSNNREIVISKNGKKISFAVDGAGNSKGGVNNNTDAKKAEKLQKELEKATSEQEKAEIRNKYAYSVEKTESTLTYAYNGYIDVEYRLVGNKLKESLIIKKQTGKADFKFKYNFDGMTAELQPDNSVLVKDGDEIIFVIEAPYMFDSADNYSSNITVEIKNKNKGFEYILHVDKDWLGSSDRVYPVTIDPTISGEVLYEFIGGENDPYKYETKSANGAESGLDSSDEGTMARYSDTLKVGYVYGANVKSLYYAQIPSSIPSSARIIQAYACITAYRTPTTQFPVYVSAITSSWPEDDHALAGTSQMPTYSSIIKNYTPTVVAETEYPFDITPMVQAWHSGELTNYGIILHTDSAGTSQENFCAFYSTYASSVNKRPYYVYKYADTKGVEGYWSYSTVGLPGSGVAYINRFTGHVSAEIPLLSTISELLPTSLSLVYDSQSIDSNFPLSNISGGMKLSIDRVLKPIGSGEAAYSSGFRYIYRDGDGTELYFWESTENGVTCYKDELSYGYVLTKDGNNYKLVDRNDNITWFDSSYNVTSIYSASIDSSITVSYETVGTEKYISKVTDGTGNDLTVTRDTSNNRILSVSDGMGRYVNFTYTGTNLTALTYYDGTVVNFTYCTETPIAGLLESVSGTTGASINFEYYKTGYLTKRTQKIKERSAPDADGVISDGNSISFIYNIGNATTVIDHLKKSETDIREDIKTVYVFDNLGRVTSAFNDYGASDIEYMPQNIGDLNAGRIKNTASFTAPVYNLLKNHSFENGTTGWTAMTGVTAVTDNKYIGYKGVKIVGSTSEFRRALQNITITESGTYTLSAYVKVTAPSGNNKVQLIIYESGRTEDRVRITDTAGEWQRIELTANLDASKTHIVALGIDGAAATAYFDCVQLEKSESANPYNMLENSALTGTGEGWYTNSAAQVSSVTYTDSDPTRPDFITNGYRMNGNITKQSYVLQKVYINKPASEVAFEIYGYSRADSAPHRSGLLYCLCLEMFFTDGTVQRTFKLYNNASSAWQYATKAAFASDANKNKTIDYVNACFMYYCNVNSADITGMGLSIDTTGKNYEYDDNGNLKVVNSLKDGKEYSDTYNTVNEIIKSESDEGGTWNYVYSDDNAHLLTSATHSELGYTMSYTYDENYNLLKETKLSSENYSKSISSSTEYTPDNNRIQSVTDSAGVTATYTYDESMKRLIKIVTGDAETNYAYDGNTDRVLSITSKLNQYNNTTGTVTYGYDSAKRLSTITRGNTVYTIVYDEWGNQKEIKVGNTALSTNTFEQGNGNLTNTTYGNGTSVDFIYDEINRLTSKKINGVAQFTQVFNNTGAISKYNDLVTGVSWKYSYDLIGRLADITGSNNNIYRYIYDSNSRLGTVKYTVGGSTNATSYTYNTIGMAVKATNGGNSVEHSYDALGRKSGTLITTENQKTANVAYTYIDIDDERTTGLVKTVTNPLGTYTYEYDNMGRVYTANGGTVGNMYTYTPQGYIQGDYGPYPIHLYSYDAYGNITQLWDMTNDPIIYGYTNTAWGDLLTSYNGTTFTYDAIGNPENWRDGMTFGWQNGRQLASVTKSGSTYSYAYDSSGIRTSKTVNGVTTHYTYVDGKLVHQTDGTNVWWFTYDSTGNILFMEYNGDVYYYLIDGIGNIVGLVDADNNVVASYVYEAYGEIYSATGTMAQINPIRYKQYYYDTETGFYYLKTRYYDPVIARFINADGLASTGVGTTGYNMFAYCNNSPVECMDSEGTRPIDALSVRSETVEQRNQSFDYMREKHGLTKPTNTNNSMAGVWPVDRKPDSNYFKDFPTYPGTNIEHYGTDLPEDEGANIYSSYNARVSEIRTTPTGGLELELAVIICDVEYAIIYKHLSKYNVVFAGQHVKPGQIIGYVGHTGIAKGSHLHFEVRQNGHVIDPRPFLLAMR